MTADAAGAQQDAYTDTGGQTGSYFAKRKHDKITKCTKHCERRFCPSCSIYAQGGRRVPSNIGTSENGRIRKSRVINTFEE